MTKVKGDGGKPIPSKNPDKVAAPIHLRLSGSFGKKRDTSASQRDRLKTRGHHPHNGKRSICQPANAHKTTKKEAIAIRGKSVDFHLEFDGMEIKDIKLEEGQCCQETGMPLSS